MILQGDSSLCKIIISLKTMVKAIQGAGLGLLVELQSFEESHEPKLVEAIEFVQQLLQQFTDTFQPPCRLPSPREHKHAITLREGVSPIIIRPYCYPQIHKNEIKKLIKEMLE